MFKIILFTLLSLPLWSGFFPSTVHTSVKSVRGNTITLNSSFPKNGMSGVVVHRYTQDLSAINGRVIQTSAGHAKVIHQSVIHHENLPSINTKVSPNDKVIGGYLYKNVLLLAPSANVYSRITRGSSKNWIHPDLFAVFLSTEGYKSVTKANLAQFAKSYQVGLIYIVKRNKAILLDPISGKVVSSRAISNLPKRGQFPFYMRFDKLSSGWFGSTAKGNYYSGMGSI
ncbi:MAG: plasminogen-binding N-terminal domain-containing protein [Sulfurovum sp.]